KLRPVVKPCQLPPEFLGMPEIVGIEKGDEFSLGYTQPPVPCARFSGIGLPEIANALAIASHQRRRAISRTIIEHYELQGLIRLCQYAIERFSQITLTVKNWDDTTDQVMMHRQTCPSIVLSVLFKR